MLEYVVFHLRTWLMGINAEFSYKVKGENDTGGGHQQPDATICYLLTFKASKPQLAHILFILVAIPPPPPHC